LEFINYKKDKTTKSKKQKKTPEEVLEEAYQDLNNTMANELIHFRNTI